jgi:hypothetical protein
METPRPARYHGASPPPKARLRGRAHPWEGIQLTGDAASPRPPVGAASAWRRTAALLFLAGAVVASFPKALSPDWVFFSRDIHAYWYPMVSTFVRVVGEGSLPLWDPYEAYGLPLWADPGAQVAYPVTWLNLLLFPQVVYKILVLGHVLFGGLGAATLARRWGLGWLPATTAGVAFACSGPLVSAGSLPHHLCGAAWLPWVLWAVERLLQRGSRRDVAVLALVLGGQALAGSAEMCAMSGLAALLRWVVFAYGHWGRAIGRVLPLAGAAVVAALLAAVQWLPTLGLVGQTNRARFPPDMRMFWSVHPATLVDAVVPRLTSEISMGPGAREVLYGNREPFLLSLYLGAATLPLLALALRSARSQRVWALGGFVFFLMVSLGRHFRPAQLVLSIPPLSLFRYPSKYMLAAALFWALLAGLGMEVWRRSWSRGERAYGVAAGSGLLLLAAALAVASRWLLARPEAAIEAFEIPDPFRAWMVLLASRKLQSAALVLGTASSLLLLRAWQTSWARLLAFPAVVLLALDLTTAARPVNPLAPAALLSHVPPLVERIKPSAEHVRLLSVGRDLARMNRDLTRGPAGWEPEWRWSLGLQEMVVAPTGTRWGLRGSYDADFTGLAPPALPFMSQLVRHIDSTPLGLRLLQMGNVGWVIDARPDGFSLLPEVAQSVSVFSHPVRLRSVPAPFPPCYVVGGASRATSDEDAVRRISSPEFDPNQEVVLAGDGPAHAPPEAFDGSASYRVRRATRLVIETTTNAPGFLVASEAFDPTWRATVDGVPAAVERANVLFRAVAVPAGRHVVELTYRPRSIPWGVGAAFAGLLAAGFLLRPGRAASVRSSGDATR